MNTNILTTAAGLSDRDLLARLHALAGREREATAELIAHLAALDARPSAYAAQGYGSLFGYCTQALRLSEDAACARIEAARTSRRFPVILELLASGEINLTSVRLLGRHLTPENHEAVLGRARRRTRQQIEALVAELAPQPDVPSSVRKLPTFTAPPALPSPVPTATPAITAAIPEPPSAAAPSPTAPEPAARTIVRATAPARYRVQFTIGEETHQKLQRLQTLLRREIPNGDPGAIFDRAVTVLLEKVEKAKLGAAAKPQTRRVIRPRTDNSSRDIPRAVKRGAWRRDGGRCAYVSPTGHRCTERAFLEFHHVHPYAKGGPTTMVNISLRCRRHNQYESELIFGPHRFTSSASESNDSPRAP